MSAKTPNAVDVSRHDLWIGGKYVAPASGRYFDDRNPQNDSVLAHIAEATAQDVDTAVQTAHAAFVTYGRTLASEREAWLSRAAGIMEGRREALVELLIDEVGSPVGKARFEVQ